MQGSLRPTLREGPTVVIAVLRVGRVNFQARGALVGHAVSRNPVGRPNGGRCDNEHYKRMAALAERAHNYARMYKMFPCNTLHGCRPSSLVWKLWRLAVG